MEPSFSSTERKQGGPLGRGLDVLVARPLAARFSVFAAPDPLPDGYPGAPRATVTGAQRLGELDGGSVAARVAALLHGWREGGAPPRRWWGSDAPPHHLGSWWPLPGVHVWVVLEHVGGPPVSVSFPDSEQTFLIAQGEGVVWDRDRERVGFSGGPWEGRARLVVDGPAWLRRWAGSLTLRPPSAARDWVAARVGLGNLGYVVLMVLLGLVAGPGWFVAGVSYVHYVQYIATFRARRGVAYPRFVRDVVFFKSVSMVTLAALYLTSWSWSPLSAAVMVVGVGVSTRAAARLGFERTYFGYELGRLGPLRVTGFPYGVLPHPMILGAVMALLGVQVQSAFRDDWPWVVPLHVAAYLVHLAQEVASGWLGAAEEPARAEDEPSR